MSYIGKTPLVGNFQVCDAISTVNNQAAYTMQVGSVNVLPESVNNMMVSLNGVVQKPGSSFTISDSTITFSSALVTGDVINFIQIFGDVLSIGTPSDGAVTSTKLASNSVTTAKITDSNVTGAKTNFVSTSSAAGLQIKGDGTTDGTLQLNCSQNSHGIKFASPAHSSSQSYTLKFPTGNVTANKFLKVASVSGSGTSGIGQLSFADAGGANTPIVRAVPSGSQTISASTNTTVVFNTEVIDTDSAFASNTFTVPSGKAGKYYASATLLTNTAANNSLQRLQFVRNINSSGADVNVCYGNYRMVNHESNTITIFGIVDLAAADTLRLNYYSYQTTSEIYGNDNFAGGTSINIFKLI